MTEPVAGDTPTLGPPSGPPAPDLPGISSPARPAPADAYPGSNMDLAHAAAQNGHHSPARTRPVPDSHILAWLRQQASSTGQMPGRRKVIERWALGSTRAERLRGIVIDEAASQPDPRASAGETTGHQPGHPLIRLGPTG
jgi:hypothetical protein